MGFHRLWIVAALAVCCSFAPSSSQADELHASAVSVDITPPIGVPLGGFGGGGRRLIPWDVFDKYPYATFLRPSEGVIDPIRSKVVLLRNGEKRLLFASVDVVGVTQDIVDDVLDRIAPLGFARSEVFIAGTHTHSGPGTLSRSPIWQLLAMDKFQPTIYGEVLNGIVSSILQAWATLEPAELQAFSFKADDIQLNRRDKPGHFDSDANVMLVKSKRGAWIGGLVNLAVHGTSFSTKSLGFSADAPGGIERAMEARLDQVNRDDGRPQTTAIVFINGAEGDVAPRKRGTAGVAYMGEQFVSGAMAALPTARPIEPNWQVQTMLVPIGRAALTVKGCTEGVMMKLIPKWFRVNLSRYFPRSAEIALIRLGDMAMMTWPGEPTTDLGLELKRMATEAGATQAWVLGLTNGHLAYFTTPAEFFEGGYESCSSLYGPEGGTKIVKGMARLLGR